jgi:AcrR family transcriptional regulator
MLKNVITVSLRGGRSSDVKQEQRRQKEIEFTRSLIVDVAEPVFAKKGYHGATLDEIARAAGYSPAAIYAYFRNKGEVFAALLERVLCQFAGFFDAPPHLPFAERLHWVVSRTLAYAQEHRELFVTVIAHHSCVELEGLEALDQLARSFYHRDIARLSALMAEGIREGSLRSGDPEEYASALSGLGHAFVLRWLVMEQSDDLETGASRMVELFLHGCARSPGERVAATAQAT